MESIFKTLVVLFLVGILTYSLVGTENKVDYIKEKAKTEIPKRNWRVLRYEGYERGSWGNRGGKVWYHVANVDNPSIQYRVFITEWNGELHYHYGQPEQLQRVEVDFKSE